MKVKLLAGAELDLLTKDELGQELDRATAWRAEISRSVRFPQFSGATNLAGGAFTLLGETSQGSRLGPEPGFIWSIMRLAVSGGGIVIGTDLWSIYTGEVTPSRLITRSAVPVQFNAGAVVLNGGDNLAIAGVGTGAGSDVTISGQAIELPASLAWMLIGA